MTENTLDHLVVGARTLEEGAAYLAQQGIAATWDGGAAKLSEVAQGHPLLLNLAESDRLNLH